MNVVMFFIEIEVICIAILIGYRLTTLFRRKIMSTAVKLRESYNKKNGTAYDTEMLAPGGIEYEESRRKEKFHLVVLIFLVSLVVMIMHPIKFNGIGLSIYCATLVSAFIYSILNLKNSSKTYHVAVGATIISTIILMIGYIIDSHTELIGIRLNYIGTICFLWMMLMHLKLGQRL